MGRRKCLKKLKPNAIALEVLKKKKKKQQFKVLSRRYKKK